MGYLVVLIDQHKVDVFVINPNGGFLHVFVIVGAGQDFINCRVLRTSSLWDSQLEDGTLPLFLGNIIVISYPLDGKSEFVGVTHTTLLRFKIDV